MRKLTIFILFVLLCTSIEIRKITCREDLWHPPNPTPVYHISVIYPPIYKPQATRQHIQPTNLSSQGMDFIAFFEGLVLIPVVDVPGGDCSVGIGRWLHSGPCTEDDLRDYRGLTKSRAYALFAEDIKPAVLAVRELVSLPLNQAQFDALVSFVFNIGRPKFESYPLLGLLNSGDIEAALRDWARYTCATNGYCYPGLEKRRQWEIRLFSTGRYTDPESNQRVAGIPDAILRRLGVA